jgi:hypothetical protein
LTGGSLLAGSPDFDGGAEAPTGGAIGVVTFGRCAGIPAVLPDP